MYIVRCKLMELCVYLKVKRRGGLRGKEQMANDKLIRKMDCFLRIIIYLKKKCHFICVLQKSLYLCSCK